MQKYISWPAICGFKKWIFLKGFSKPLKGFLSLLAWVKWLLVSHGEKNLRHEKYGPWWVVFKVTWEAIFVYVDFSTAEINGIECLALDVFFGTFSLQVLTSLYRCSCLLSDKISCYFLAGPSMPSDSCADGFAGGSSGETSEDASEMAARTGRLPALYAHRFRFSGSGSCTHLFLTSIFVQVMQTLDF